MSNKRKRNIPRDKIIGKDNTLRPVDEPDRGPRAGGAAFSGSGVKPLSSMPRGEMEDIAAQLARAKAAGFMSSGVQAPAPIMGSPIKVTRPHINLPGGLRQDETTLRAALTRPFAGTPVAGMRPINAGPSLRPHEVLEMHASLTEAFRVPTVKQVSYLDGFIEAVFRRAREEGGVVYEAQAWEYLFYPALDGATFAKVLWRQLNRGKTYQVAPRMMDAVADAYTKALPYVDSMNEKDLPGEAGFVWFDKPLSFTDSSGKIVKQRAISWSMQTVRYASAEEMADGVPDTPLMPGSEGLSIRDWEKRRTTAVTAYPGVRITAWCHVDDPDDYWDADIMEEIRQLGSNNMIMSHSVIVPFGQRFLNRLEESPAPEVTGDDLARWVLMLFRFFNDEITVTSRPQIPRATQRRAQKSLKHGEVHVVMLRRAHSIRTEEAVHRIVNWSCRWPVEGFYRHIDSYEPEVDEEGKPRRHQAVPDEAKSHCVACGARITWVHPHIRGPSWLPIKESKQLRKLVR